MQQAGYQTAIVGKWHLFTEPTGFDFYSVLPGHGRYFDSPFKETGRPWGANGNQGGVIRAGYVSDVITDIATLGGYEDERTRITVEITDARVAMRELEGEWDVCYQDAFSPQTNPALWTKEYFADIARLMGEEGIVTTYSTALSTRLALYENGFGIYLNRGEGYRNATIATRRELGGYEKVDMAHKISCNPEARPLSDENLAL